MGHGSQLCYSFKASLETATFDRAEVSCLPDPVTAYTTEDAEDEAFGRPSRLAFSDKRQHLEFMAQLVSLMHNASSAHWVGLDNKDVRNKWQTSGGEDFDFSGPLWKSGI